MQLSRLRLWLVLPLLILLGAVLGPAVAGGTQGAIGGAGVGAITSALLLWILSTKTLGFV